jgi:hypothetical protein
MRSTPASRARLSATRAWVTSSGVTAFSRNSVRTDESAARNRGHVGQVADDLLDAGPEALLSGCANEGADLCAGTGQALDDEGTDGAGGTGDENAHGNLQGVKRKWVDGGRERE